MCQVGLTLAQALCVHIATNTGFSLSFYHITSISDHNACSQTC